MSELKLFNKWDTTKIEVKDIALKDYINLKPIIVPKTGGRNVNVSFWKSKYHIVERLINKVMVPGHKGKKHLIFSHQCSGQSNNAYEQVKHTLELIEEKMKRNPVEVLVGAIENAAPREEITTIEYGGARYPQSVDCAPQRRVDIAIKIMVQGSFQKSFNKKTKFHEALADEIMKAFANDSKSAAIAKKMEVERQAESSR